MSQQIKSSEIDPTILALAVGHLELNGRARRFAAQFKTIGDLLIAEREQNKCPDRTWTPTIRKEINQITSLLAKTVANRGWKDWDKFRITRKSCICADWIYFASPHLENFDSSVRSVPIEALRLRTRSSNALHDAGVATIGQLVDRARNGLVNLRAGGALTARDIIESLEALRLSTVSGGLFDWKQYLAHRGPNAKHRDHMAAPSSVYRQKVNRNLLLGINKRGKQRPSFAGDGRRIGDAVQTELRRLLTDVCPGGLSLEALNGALESRLGRFAPTTHTLKRLLSSLDWIERPNPGHFRAKAPFLKRSADHYVRIIREAGVPMHYRTIGELAEKPSGVKRQVSHRAVAARLHEDKRFIPARRRGWWMLTDLRNELPSEQSQKAVVKTSAGDAR